MNDRSTRRNRALLSATLFAVSTTLVRKLGARYVMDREARLSWSDLGVALVTGAVGYVSFRNRYDDDFNVT